MSTSTPRVALITGASSGLGLACAQRLHQAGWGVAGASRRSTAPGGWHGLVAGRLLPFRLFEAAAKRSLGVS
ncbi:MAG TPA: SDR family NAD(P)-dependent oxidoreductase [Streptosporangiaceae bacterium]